MIYYFLVVAFPFEIYERGRVMPMTLGEILAIGNFIINLIRLLLDILRKKK